ncbi:hypothetical protein MIR68_001583 [Amoeboaphelidium protococcarum]|nr:hypothetical protein MIR68_001583 [Amoeboaphelidium protococcarum]
MDHDQSFEEFDQLLQQSLDVIDSVSASQQPQKGNIQSNKQFANISVRFTEALKIHDIHSVQSSCQQSDKQPLEETQSYARKVVDDNLSNPSPENEIIMQKDGEISILRERLKSTEGELEKLKKQMDGDQRKIEQESKQNQSLYETEIQQLKTQIAFLMSEKQFQMAPVNSAVQPDKQQLAIRQKSSRDASVMTTASIVSSGRPARKFKIKRRIDHHVDILLALIAKFPNSQLPEDLVSQLIKQKPKMCVLLPQLLEILQLAQTTQRQDVFDAINRVIIDNCDFILVEDARTFVDKCVQALDSSLMPGVVISIIAVVRKYPELFSSEVLSLMLNASQYFADVLQLLTIACTDDARINVYFSVPDRLKLIQKGMYDTASPSPIRNDIFSVPREQNVQRLIDFYRYMLSSIYKNEQLLQNFCQECLQVLLPYVKVTFENFYNTNEKPGIVLEQSLHLLGDVYRLNPALFITCLKNTETFLPPHRLAVSATDLLYVVLKDAMHEIQQNVQSNILQNSLASIKLLIQAIKQKT